MRHIVVSDIHGCIQTLEVLLFKRLKIKPGDQLFFLGDYIDRGPGSKEVLDLLMYLKEENPQTVILRGNHEQMMLKAAKSEEQFDLWMSNEAQATLKSFGINPPYSVESPAEIPSAYFAFIRSMDYFHLYGNIFLSHAGADLSRKRPMKHKKAMLWITDLKMTRKKLHENRMFELSIDTGAVYDYKGMGYLSALDLDHMEMMSVRRVDMVQK